MKRLCGAALALTALFAFVIGVAVTVQMHQIAPPVWTYVQQMPAPIPEAQYLVWPMPNALPPPPFTLEVTGRFSNSSPPSARWGINLDVASLQISNDGQFYAPNMPNAIWFYGLHPAGASNQISLTVINDDQAQVRLNGQLVWSAPLPTGTNSSHLWSLFAESDMQAQSAFTLQRVVIYIPNISG